MDEMNGTMFQNIMALPENSELYFLGDLTWDNSWLPHFFDNMYKKKFEFHFVKGNHDNIPSEIVARCASFSDLKEVKIGGVPAILCHYPMSVWNKSHYNSFHLYGHIHADVESLPIIEHKMMGKTLNVNVEFHNFKPWSEDEIVEYMKTRPDNWDKIEKTEGSR
jgi:calcineurin-like phosphoesterase family protein